MGYAPIVPAEPADAAGTPWSERYGDLYHSAQGGLEQTRHVFIKGNGLPEAWANRETFVILETGFGLGLNFLAAWQTWRDDPRRCRRLHFVSVEKHPFRRDDLARLHARWPELAEPSARLIAAWPLLVPGLHRLDFGGVTLTLAFGDALALLPRLVLSADAIFLDGFSPDRNPDMWSAAVAAQLARLAAPGGRLATWSVAEDVTRNLAAAGFALEKRPGFGNKRYMLAGRAPGARVQSRPHDDRRIVVVGAGAAGSAAANRLAARGFEATVLERHAEPAQGASGNKAGVFRPLPSLDDSPLARLLRAGALHGRRHLESLPGARFGITGVLHLARDARHEAAQRRVVAEQAPPPEFVRFVERDEAARLAGWPVEAGGWWFPGGGWINPPSLCRANLEGIDARFGAGVARIERAGGLWRALDAGGATLAEAPTLVLANGTEAPRLAPQHPLPIRVGRGLVSHLPEDAAPPFHIVATRNGYVTPAVDGIHCFGATLAVGDGDFAPRVADHVENLVRLDGILPGYGRHLDPAKLDGRVGLRPMSPDRLPVVGPLSASDDLWIIDGFGARGLVFASICAELLAAQIAGEPLPLESDLVAALDPARFARRHPAKV